LSDRRCSIDIDLRGKAQRRADRIALFRAELAELERGQGLILTPEQRARLDAHLVSVLSTLSREFGVDAMESAKRISWGMRVASLLGAVALGTAMVLFLHRFWGSVPTAAHGPRRDKPYRIISGRSARFQKACSIPRRPETDVLMSIFHDVIGPVMRCRLMASDTPIGESMNLSLTKPSLGLMVLG